MLTPVGWSTSSLEVPILTTTRRIDLCRRPSLFTIRLTMLNTPVHLSIAADTGLILFTDNFTMQLNPTHQRDHPLLPPP